MKYLVRFQMPAKGQIKTFRTHQEADCDLDARCLVWARHKDIEDFEILTCERV